MRRINIKIILTMTDRKNNMRRKIMTPGGVVTREEKIDFVIYWVDGNDMVWQKKKASFEVTEEQDARKERYRDWDNLIYLFRGIEKFAPWVNKVYFISDSQVPVWMNRNHPRLVLVDHSDYIPEKYLPVFSSHPIELNLHRIPDLEEKFVIFNDDCFLTNYTKPTDFFENGFPKDIFMEYPVMCGGNNPIFSNILVNDFNLIGKYYERKEYRKLLKKKILTLRYGFYFFYNLLMYLIPFPRFFGLLTPHFSRPYLKSSFIELWEKEPQKLDRVCHNKFRTVDDVNVYIFRLWSMMKGNFVPGNIFKSGKAFFIREDDPKIYDAIKKGQYKMICLNDECSDAVFGVVKSKVRDSFQSLLPEKSSYEN